MIRTETVNLSVISAIAYRQRLTSGGAGVVILSPDCRQPGIASISKTSGEAIPTANTPTDFYTAEAFAEAIALTARLPYRKRSAPAAPVAAPEEPATPEIEASEVVVDSAEYQKIVDAYTDKDGRLSYALLNKDLIRFTHVSSHARAMISGGATLEEIRLYAVASKFRAISGNRHLTDEQAMKICELLDEVSDKGVLTEFNLELRKKLKR